MSDDRPVEPGERRVESIRREHGVPVRPGPVAAGALLGGALGAWASDLPGRMLAAVELALGAAPSLAMPDGGAAVRSLLLSVAGAAWAPVLLAAAGAACGVLLQTGGNVRRIAPRVARWRGPSGRAIASVPLRAVAALAVLAAGAAAVAADWPRIAVLPALPLGTALSSSAAVAGDAIAAAFAALVLVAAADAALARWSWRRSLRMTPEEAHEDGKGSEGDRSLGRRRIHASRAAAARAGRELHGRAA